MDGDQHGAIERGHDIVDIRIIGQHEPGQDRLQRPDDVMVDQPFGERLLDPYIGGARRPVEGARRQAHEAENDQHGVPGLGLDARHMHDLGVGRAARQGHCTTKAAASSTHMTMAGATHGLHRHKRGAIERLGLGAPGFGPIEPGARINAKVEGRQL